MKKVGTSILLATLIGERCVKKSPSYAASVPPMALRTRGAVNVPTAVRWDTRLASAEGVSVEVKAGGMTPVAVTRPSHKGMKPASSWPPEATTSR